MPTNGCAESIEESATNHKPQTMHTTLITLLIVSGFADRPDLVGRVVSADDQPLAGAHVSIDSAAVRQGTSPLCPSFYSDCRKSAETDKQGRFRIASVDPELIFNVLVVAGAYPPVTALPRNKTAK
jgi:hypothetical protein